MTGKEFLRQKFLKKERYSVTQRWLEDSVTRAREILAEEELTPSAQGRLRWRIASQGLELLILHYTAGRPIAELRNQLPEVVEDFEAYVGNEISPCLMTPRRNIADTLEITQLEAYVYVFWLLALSKLFAQDSFIPKVMRWVDKTYDFNRGRDILFENVVQALTGAHVEAEKVLLHPHPYRPLGRATVFAPEDRAALVKEFLDSWYKDMRSCYWHGTHTPKDGTSYFGYWAFEAALVTVLWDIDDRSYRDHLVYPKDLADWARAHRLSA